MKISARIFLCVTLAAGCLMPTDQKAAKAREEDSLDAYPATPVAMDKSAFRYYYRESQNFYNSTLANGFNGSFLVAKKGEIVFEKHAGRERLGKSEAVNEHSAFHIASVSKTFTGMAVCKLWEQGKLDINEELSKYFPEFNYKGVTIKSLLNHRSGLPNYVNVMESLGWNTKKFVKNRDVLDFLIKNKAKLAVGTPNRSFTYCNTNYALLALLVEKVSGMSFPQYIKEVFLIPLQMEDTYVFTPADSARSLPSYKANGQREAFTYLDYVYGDKNIYSTARDLLKWDQALTQGYFFRSSTLDAAYSGYSFEKPGLRNYGLGWRLLLYPNNEKVVYHNGWWHGNNAVFARLVNDSATIIVLGNRYNKRIYEARKLYPVFGREEISGAGEE